MSVRTDTVNLIINVNGSKAQNDLNELRKRAADLTFEMKTNLVKGTREYIAASGELKQVTGQMNTLKQSIGITALSMRELSSERARLTTLRNSATPLSKEFKDFELQLQKVIARENELKASIQGVRSSTASLHQTNEGLGGSFQRIFLRVGEYLSAFAIYEKLKGLFTSTIEEANNAELATSNLLNTLENAGRKDVFERMIKQADKLADIYKAISPEELKKVFGKLVDYGKLTENQINSLTEVIINYSAKQKISVTEATDVFTKALEGNARGLKSYGINIKDAGNFSERLNLILGPMADKVRGAEAAFESTNKGALTKFTEAISRAKTSVGLFLLSLTGLAEKTHELAVTAKEEADQGQILVSRYEEISKKVNKTAAEKAELKAITAQLTTIFGTSVVSINKETGALELNLQATKDLIKQKLLLANQDAGGLALKINATEDDNKKIVEQIKIRIKALKDLGEAYGVVNEDFLNPHKDYKSKDLASFFEPGKFSQKAVDQIDKLRNEVSQLNNTWNDGMDDIEKYQKKLQDFGFSKEDVDKLFNPGLPKGGVIGNGDPDADKKKQANSDYDAILKEAAAFHKKLLELKFTAEQVAKSEDQKEIDAVKHKYAEILKEFDALQKKLNGKDKGLLGPRADITLAEQKEVDALIEKQRKAKFEKEQKDIKDNLSKVYADQKAQIEINTADEKDKEAQRFVNKEIDYKTYQANLAAIDLQSQKNLLHNAEEFAKEKVIIDGKSLVAVEQAAKDETAFKRGELEKQTADSIAAFNAKQAEIKLLSDLAARAEISRVNTKGIIAGGKGDFSGVEKAEKERAKIILSQRNAALDEEARVAKTKIQETGEARMRIEKQIDDNIKDQKDEARAEYDQSVIDADNALMEKRIAVAEAFVNATLSLFTNINNLLNNIEDRKLQKEIDRNNKAKNDLKKNLDHKLISQKQYDQKVAALDEDIDKRKKELSLKQAKRQKALNIFEAIANTASAVVSALGAKPWGPWNLALAALVGSLGLVQVGVIASQPLPEAGDGDWFRKGPKHKDKEKGIPILIERDEAVIKADAMTNKEVYTVTGTTSQITSKLNSLKGGVNWDAGAQLQIPKFRERPAQLNPNLPRIMEHGGLVRPMNDGGSNQVALFNQMSGDLKRMVDKQDQMIEEIKNQKDRLHAVVSIKEYRETERKYDNARKASGMSQ